MARTISEHDRYPPLFLRYYVSPPTVGSGPGVKPQSRNVMLSLHECERGGRNLDDVGAALRVEQIGTAELMRKRLAILTETDHAVGGNRRSVCNNPPYLTATETQFGRCAHLVSVQHGRVAAQNRGCLRRLDATRIAEIPLGVTPSTNSAGIGGPARRATFTQRTLA